jgi:mono/diheme cytochrome c family protein
MRTKVLFLSAALGLAVAGTAVAQQPVDAAALYTHTCASCHGPHGTPSPAMARAMAGIPDFAAASMATVPDSVLRDAIMDGKGRMMAAYKSRLSPAEVTALVRYLKGFSHH